MPREREREEEDGTDHPATLPPCRPATLPPCHPCRRDDPAAAAPHSWPARVGVFVAMLFLATQFPLPIRLGPCYHALRLIGPLAVGRPIDPTAAHGRAWLRAYPKIPAARKVTHAQAK